MRNIRVRHGGGVGEGRMRTSAGAEKNRTTPPSKLPLLASSQKWLGAQRLHRMRAALQLKEKCAYLLELLDSTLVDTSALVDQVCVYCELV